MASHWRSYADLQTDLRKWIPHLPPLKAIAGVPRSGIIPATMLAMELHIPVLPIESVLDGAVTPYRPNKSRTLNGGAGYTLVLDDTCWGGKTVEELRPLLAGKEDVLLAAVYVQAANAHLVDLAGYTLESEFHTFAWNLFRDGNVNVTATDMDGVLCEDWSGPEEGPIWSAKYADHLANAKPLYLPRVPPDAPWKLRAVVTSRLHGHTDATVGWLSKHNVPFTEIVTAPYESCAERIRKKGFAERKSSIYRHLAGKGVRWFVESDPGQADIIARLTGLPVIDFAGQRGINCADPVPLFRQAA